MKRTIIKILITLIIFVVLVWSSGTTSTSSIILVKEVRSNELVIETMNTEIKTIKINHTLQNLINEENKYFIKYTEGRRGKPKLKHIEPIIK